MRLGRIMSVCVSNRHNIWLGYSHYQYCSMYYYSSDMCFVYYWISTKDIIIIIQKHFQICVHDCDLNVSSKPPRWYEMECSVISIRRQCIYANNQCSLDYWPMKQYNTLTYHNVHAVFHIVLYIDLLCYSDVSSSHRVNHLNAHY